MSKEASVSLCQWKEVKGATSHRQVAGPEDQLVTDVALEITVIAELPKAVAAHRCVERDYYFAHCILKCTGRER